MREPKISETLELRSQEGSYLNGTHCVDSVLHEGQVFRQHQRGLWPSGVC